MLDLLEFLRQPGIPETAKLLLLIDDVHKMDAAAVDICGSLLGALGIRSPRIRDRVRVVFTSTSVPVPGQQIAVKAIENFLSEATWVTRKSLDAFQAPLEEHLAYEYFLLRFRDEKNDRPLCVNWAEEKYVESFFKACSKAVNGIPSRLCSHAPTVIHTTLILGEQFAIEVLRPAEDEDWLAQVKGQTR